MMMDSAVIINDENIDLENISPPSPPAGKASHHQRQASQELSLSMKAAFELIRSARKEAESMMQQQQQQQQLQASSAPLVRSAPSTPTTNKSPPPPSSSQSSDTQAYQRHVKMLEQKNEELMSENGRLVLELQAAKTECDQLRHELHRAHQRAVTAATRTPSPFAISPESICESRSFLELTPTKDDDGEATDENDMSCNTDVDVNETNTNTTTNTTTEDGHQFAPAALQFNSASTPLQQPNDTTPPNNHKRTSSAVKIQAAFRGHIERAAIPHERALSDIPLNSPSTPLPSTAHQEALMLASPSPLAESKCTPKVLEYSSASSPTSTPPQQPQSRIPTMTGGRQQQQQRSGSRRRNGNHATTTTTTTNTNTTTPMSSKRSYSLDRSEHKRRQKRVTPARSSSRKLPATAAASPSLSSTRRLPASLLKQTKRQLLTKSATTTNLLSRTLESPLPLLLSSASKGNRNRNRHRRRRGTSIDNGGNDDDDDELDTDVDDETTDDDNDDAKSDVLSSGSAGLQTLEVLDDSMKIKSILTELRAQRKIITTTDANWSLRVKAMNRLEQMIRAPVGNSPVNLPSWWTEMDLLKKCIAVQLDDLRSSIVREACRLLLAIGDVCGRTKEFADTVAFFVPVLLKRLYVTIKVISQSGDECIRGLLIQCLAHRCVPRLLHAAKDSHTQVRKGAGDYITIILAKESVCHTEEAGIEAYMDKIAHCIATGVDDGDKDVRKGFRDAFAALRTRWPERGDALFAELSDSARKAIEREVAAA